jgi:hypothetical protein
VTNGDGQETTQTIPVLITPDGGSSSTLALKGGGNAMETDRDVGEGIVAWMSANTLADLGALTARWLEGSLTAHSGYKGTLNAETANLLPVLARFNRAGLVTVNSQPGEDVDGCTQRAFVSGFCNEQVAQTVAAACMPTDLICVCYWPEAVSFLNVPVSLDFGKALTWAGMSMDVEDINHLWADLRSASAVDALVDACQVWVIDPRWGRNHLLWTTIDLALAGPPLTGALPSDY